MHLSKFRTIKYCVPGIPSNRKFKGDYRECRLFVRLDIFQERIFIRVTPGGKTGIPEDSVFEDAKLPGLRISGDTLTFWINTRTPEHPEEEVKLLIDGAIDRLKA